MTNSIEIISLLNQKINQLHQFYPFDRIANMIPFVYLHRVEGTGWKIEDVEAFVRKRREWCEWIA
jgi:hypothetical protein